MTSSQATIHIDGGSRGNPGPASYAVVMTSPDHETLEECDTLGNTTNNVAEYTALVRALELAQIYHFRNLSIFSDSELLVKQMNGVYKVKSEELRGLYDSAQRLVKTFDQVKLTHVRREKNKRADQLCNLALDGQAMPRLGLPRVPQPAKTDPLTLSFDDSGRRLLQSFAKEWSQSGADESSIDEAWEQMQLLFHTHGYRRE